MSDAPAAETAAPSTLTAALLAGEQPKYPQLVVIARELATRVAALEELVRDLQARPAPVADALPAPAAPSAPLGDDYCPGCGSRLSAGHFEGCPNDTEESRDG